ncbi:MAG: hypothetical protein ISR99_02760 [Parcubacteria group bacterium]|nr:hypothetical protein [Parcubacteria group bacterium]
MTKSALGLFSTLLVLVVCFAFAPTSAVARSKVYKGDEALYKILQTQGFTLELPRSWSGKCSVPHKAKDRIWGLCGLTGEKTFVNIHMWTTMFSDVMSTALVIQKAVGRKSNFGIKPIETQIRSVAGASVTVNHFGILFSGAALWNHASSIMFTHPQEENIRVLILVSERSWKELQGDEKTVRAVIDFILKGALKFTGDPTITRSFPPKVEKSKAAEDPARPEN